jgi:nitroimidazol reductase NimA-like FMN-containing flavoprotein (pyridoxamine 5'-phosphate oxidase superfamily)
MKTIPDSLIPSRLAKRAHYDKETLYSILDEALYCTISYVSEGKPFSIPTAFVRYEDKIYIHGSVGSHFILELAKGIDVCISVTLMDALVIAKSAFHHSVNYRSVIIYARGESIEDLNSKTEAFEWLTNKMVPGSWNYLRPIKNSEVQKTVAIAFSLDQASAKVRSGMPIDDDADQSLPIWSGVLPFEKGFKDPLADELSKNIPLPKHLNPKHEVKG